MPRLAEGNAPLSQAKFSAAFNGSPMNVRTSLAGRSDGSCSPATSSSSRFRRSLHHSFATVPRSGNGARCSVLPRRPSSDQDRSRIFYAPSPVFPPVVALLDTRYLENPVCPFNPAPSGLACWSLSRALDGSENEDGVARTKTPEETSNVELLPVDADVRTDCRC